MTRRYTIQEADALIPEVAERMERLGDLQRVAAERLARARRRARGNGDRGGLDPGVAAEMRRVLEWFEERDLLVTGVTPALVDFPAHYGGGDVLLCWTEGEERIAWYHSPEAGFAGRRPVEELDA